MTFTVVADSNLDVITYLTDPENCDAVFQVASQFNCLEMPGPGVAPTEGITDYVSDLTQGPACSLAAPAATLFRNYCVKHSVNKADANGTHEGQLTQQLNLLSDALNIFKQIKIDEFIDYKNGYILRKEDRSPKNNEPYETIGLYLNTTNDNDESLYKMFVDKVRVGVQWDTQVWDIPKQKVCQVFCSGLSMAYDPTQVDITNESVVTFCTAVLEGAYECTLLAAEAKRRQLKKDRIKVFLTQVGCGVYENKTEWVAYVLKKLFTTYKNLPLDVCMLIRGQNDHVYDELLELVSNSFNITPSNSLKQGDSQNMETRRSDLPGNVSQFPEIQIGQYKFELVQKYEQKGRSCVLINQTFTDNVTTKVTTKTQFFAYTSLSGAGFWRYAKLILRQYQKGLHYTASSFLHIDLQIFINNNIHKIRIEDWNESDNTIMSHNNATLLDSDERLDKSLDETIFKDFKTDPKNTCGNEEGTIKELKKNLKDLSEKLKTLNFSMKDIKRPWNVKRGDKFNLTGEILEYICATHTLYVLSYNLSIKNGKDSEWTVTNKYCPIIIIPSENEPLRNITNYGLYNKYVDSGAYGCKFLEYSKQVKDDELNIDRKQNRYYHENMAQYIYIGDRYDGLYPFTPDTSHP
jgi:chaperonin cofactor prefoldin